MPKSKKWLATAGLTGLLLGTAALGRTAFGAEQDSPLWEEQMECDSREEAEAYAFPEFRQVEGRRYRLVRTEILPAEETAPQAGKTWIPQVRLVTSPVMLPGENYEPEPEILRDGSRYRLLRTETVPVESETDGQTVEGSRVYAGVTERPDIPEEAEFTVWDEERQENRTVRLPLARLQEVWSWREDFQATLTAAPAEALEYELGGQYVTLGEEAPGLEAYEDAVLAELGLDQAFFQIETSQWVGDAYQTDGGWVREIRVTGRRYAADYTAWYAGELPAPEGVVYHSIYQEIPEPEEEEAIPYLARAIYRREEQSRFPAALPAVAGAVATGILVVVWVRRRKKGRDR